MVPNFDELKSMEPKFNEQTGENLSEIEIKSFLVEKIIPRFNQSTGEPLTKEECENKKIEIKRIIENTENIRKKLHSWLKKNLKKITPYEKAFLGEDPAPNSNTETGVGLDKIERENIQKQKFDGNARLSKSGSALYKIAYKYNNMSEEEKRNIPINELKSMYIYSSRCLTRMGMDYLSSQTYHNIDAQDNIKKYISENCFHDIKFDGETISIIHNLYTQGHVTEEDLATLVMMNSVWKNQANNDESTPARFEKKTIQRGSEDFKKYASGFEYLNNEDEMTFYTLGIDQGSNLHKESYQLDITTGENTRMIGALSGQSTGYITGKGYLSSSENSGNELTNSQINPTPNEQAPMACVPCVKTLNTLITKYDANKTRMKIVIDKSINPRQILADFFRYETGENGELKNPDGSALNSHQISLLKTYPRNIACQALNKPLFDLCFDEGIPRLYRKSYALSNINGLSKASKKEIIDALNTEKQPTPIDENTELTHTQWQQACNSIEKTKDINHQDIKKIRGLIYPQPNQTAFYRERPIQITTDSLGDTESSVPLYMAHDYPTELNCPAFANISHDIAHCTKSSVYPGRTQDEVQKFICNVQKVTGNIMSPLIWKSVDQCHTPSCIKNKPPERKMIETLRECEIPPNSFGDHLLDLTLEKSGQKYVTKKELFEKYLDNKHKRRPAIKALFEKGEIIVEFKSSIKYGEMVNVSFKGEEKKKVNLENIGTMYHKVEFYKKCKKKLNQMNEQSKTTLSRLSITVNTQRRDPTAPVATTPYPCTQVITPHQGPGHG